MPINRFRGEYFFLSNFFPCREGVVYEGDVFPTSEHAYQAAKIEERQGRESFTCGGSLGDNPMDAKSKGGKVKQRPNWHRIRVDVMLEVVRSKFALDIDLQQKLLATRSQQIVEGHTGDKFWGGKANHLGNILKRVREELRVQYQQVTTRTSVDDDAEDPSGPPKQRSKGNSDRQSIFQGQLKAWTDTDKSKGADEEATQVDDLDERCAVSSGSGGSCHSRLSNDPAVEDQDAPPAGFAGGHNQGTLPSSFVAWLRSALEQELSATDAESLMCSAEVILGGPLDDPLEALGDAAELLKQEGASITGDELEVQWALCVGR